MNRFYSNGKLLLTGEYVVLDGAKSLALPTQKGQSLTIKPTKDTKLIWESFTHTNELWLQVEFDIPKIRIISETFNATKDGGSDSLALKLQEILLKARNLNTGFLNNTSGCHVQTKLHFPLNWGLGSSSTLVNNIAQWAQVDAFTLQFKTFGGSGYDIACAQQAAPLLYQLINLHPKVELVTFDPPFKEQLFFIHLNKKQNSREGIAQYKKFTGNRPAIAQQISALTEQLLNTSSMSSFEQILREHEQIIASIIDQKPIQDTFFSDYFGQTKSLGAWGGDFILATGNDDTPNYFKKRGFTTIIPYREMVL